MQSEWEKAIRLRTEALQAVTRRHFLRRSAAGLGGLALGSLMDPSLFAKAAKDSAPTDPLSPKPAHFAPKAKRVIYLHMAGSPPQHDLFDYKPALNKHNGEPCPKWMFKGKDFAFISGHPELLGSPYKFGRYGESGTWLSELLPHMRDVVDDVAVVKSMVTDQFNHAPAQLLVQTGRPRPGRPSMGSWVTYGLGSEAENLPAFIVLVSGGKFPSAGKNAWGSGFLPSIYQGVQCRSEGDPVLFLSNPKGMSRKVRKDTIQALEDMNKMQHAEVGDPETLARIAQYEMAFRMQTSVPNVMDISDEPQHIHEMYGTNPGEASFANNALLARRLVEQGVRFVQLYDWGWDTHGTNKGNDLVHQLPKKTGQTEQACAALIKDLKQRGLLEDTLVVWSGEFGRTPLNEERNGSDFLGRDHHRDAFTLWMAGGGIKGGVSYGQTDEMGYKVTDKPVSVHDFQATILNQLGLAQDKLTYHFKGRDFRLTGTTGGRVVHDLLT